MNKKKIFGLLGLGAFIALLNLVIGCLFLKFFWSNIAYRLFPKLVESGQINPSISFSDALFIGMMLFCIIRALSGRLITMDKKGSFKTNRLDKEIEGDIENK
jgi:zinc transporter ZupT